MTLDLCLEAVLRNLHNLSLDQLNRLSDAVQERCYQCYLHVKSRVHEEDVTCPLPTTHRPQPVVPSGQQLEEEAIAREPPDWGYASAVQWSNLSYPDPPGMKSAPAELGNALRAWDRNHSNR